MINFEEVKAQAKANMTICKMCKACNGDVCRGWTPGPGGKGTGSTFVRNVAMLKKVTLNMRLIRENQEVDSQFDFFGQMIEAPIMAAPIANVKINYGSTVDELTYLNGLTEGCLKEGLPVFLGDGANREAFEMPLKLHKQLNKQSIMTIKPWTMDLLMPKLEEVKACNPLAVAMDIDAAGLILLKKQGVPVSFKSIDELKAIKAFLGVPFILKGILTIEDAQAALDAGVDAIVVSNHGGRVLDDCISTIEVLEEITTFVKGRCKVFVDGGFRSGSDVFKALALGADGVLIGRPFSHASIGGQAEGVSLYANKLIQELKECMRMTSSLTLKDIKRSSVNVHF